MYTFFASCKNIPLISCIKFHIISEKRQLYCTTSLSWFVFVPPPPPPLSPLSPLSPLQIWNHPDIYYHEAMTQKRSKTISPVTPNLVILIRATVEYLHVVGACSDGVSCVSVSVCPYCLDVCCYQVLVNSFRSLYKLLVKAV